jgi:hypothetical protein
MVESPAQSGRMRTLIHPGPISRGHASCRNGSGGVIVGGRDNFAVEWFSGGRSHVQRYVLNSYMSRHELVAQIASGIAPALQSGQPVGRDPATRY